MFKFNKFQEINKRSISKLSKIKKVIKPKLSIKDHLFQATKSIGEFVKNIIKALQKMIDWISKNPFLRPFYLVVSKLLIPISIMLYILKKFKWLRTILQIIGLLLGIDNDLISINFALIEQKFYEFYDFIKSNFLGFGITITSIFSRIVSFFSNKSSVIVEEKVKLPEYKDYKKDVDKYQIPKIKKPDYDKIPVNEVNITHVKSDQDYTIFSTKNFWFWLFVINMLLLTGIVLYFYWDSTLGGVIAVPGIFTVQWWQDLYNDWLNYLRGGRPGNPPTNPGNAVAMHESAILVSGQETPIAENAGTVTPTPQSPVVEPIFLDSGSVTPTPQNPEPHNNQMDMNTLGENSSSGNSKGDRLDTSNTSTESESGQAFNKNDSDNIYITPPHDVPLPEMTNDELHSYDKPISPIHYSHNYLTYFNHLNYYYNLGIVLPQTIDEIKDLLNLADLNVESFNALMDVIQEKFVMNDKYSYFVNKAGYLDIFQNKEPSGLQFILLNWISLIKISILNNEDEKLVKMLVMQLKELYDYFNEVGDDLNIKFDDDTITVYYVIEILYEHYFQSRKDDLLSEIELLF